MTSSGSVWVGMLDLADDRPIIDVSGAPRPDQILARILIRIHSAPLGYVEVPLWPTESLQERSSQAAGRTLPEAIRQHHDSDRAVGGAGSSAGWASRVSCPRNFPDQDRSGMSVIVCTRDRPAELRDCLSALQNVTYQPLEILIVDNAPSDEATRKVVADVARDDPRIRYTQEPQPGLSRARNHGLAIATFDLIAFTDDDIVVEPGWPAAIAAGFAADPETACVTGPVASRSLDTPSERYFDSRYPWGDAFSARRYDLGDYRDGSPLYPFKAGIFGTGANFAIRRDVMEKLGGFDVLLGAGGPGRGGEDLDTFARIILSGYRICYVPSTLVWHRHRATDAALSKQVYDYGHGLGAYLAKRILTREMPVNVLVRSAGQSIVIGALMRRAARTSRAPTRGWRLAASEAQGVVAGALTYLQVRRSPRLLPGGDQLLPKRQPSV